MPNPRHTYTLPYSAASKAREQVMGMSDYLKRFLGRLEELKVGKDDPLYAKAQAARSAMIDLGIAIVDSAKPPGKSRWE